MKYQGDHIVSLPWNWHFIVRCLSHYRGNIPISDMLNVCTIDRNEKSISNHVLIVKSHFFQVMIIMILELLSVRIVTNKQFINNLPSLLLWYVLIFMLNMCEMLFFLERKQSKLVHLILKNHTDTLETYRFEILYYYVIKSLEKNYQ